MAQSQTLETNNNQTKSKKKTQRLARGLGCTVRIGLKKIKFFTSFLFPVFQVKVVDLTGVAMTFLWHEKKEEYVPSLKEPSWPVSHPRCLSTLRCFREYK